MSAEVGERGARRALGGGAALVVAVGSGMATAQCSGSLLGAAGAPLDLASAAVVAWLVGLVTSGALAAALPSPWRGAPTFRAALVLLAAGCLAALGRLLATGQAEPLAATVLGLGAALLGVAAARPAIFATLGLRGRVATLGLALVVCLGWGSRTLAYALEEHRAQDLPGFTLELAAAYPLDEPPAPGDARAGPGRPATLEGEPFVVHRADALVLTEAEVRRVRWLEDRGRAFVTIRFGEAAAAAVDERARRRFGRYDALLVDGEPVLAVFHFGPQDPLLLSDPDSRRLWTVFERLTRPARAGEAGP